MNGPVPSDSVGLKEEEKQQQYGVKLAGWEPSVCVLLRAPSATEARRGYTPHLWMLRGRGGGGGGGGGGERGRGRGRGVGGGGKDKKGET